MTSITPASSGTSIGEQFPVQQARVRELLREYLRIGPAGSFGVMMLEGVLQRADQAIASGNIVAIVQSYQEMVGCE